MIFEQSIVHYPFSFVHCPLFIFLFSLFIFLFFSPPPPSYADDETVLKIVYANEKIAKLMEGMEVVKTIIVKNKLVNLILKPAK